VRPKSQPVRIFTVRTAHPTLENILSLLALGLPPSLNKLSLLFMLTINRDNWPGHTFLGNKLSSISKANQTWLDSMDYISISRFPVESESHYLWRLHHGNESRVDLLTLIVRMSIAVLSAICTAPWLLSVFFHRQFRDTDASDVQLKLPAH